MGEIITTVIPAKSEGDVEFCLKSLSKILTRTMYTPLEPMRIDRSLADRTNTQVINKF